MLLGKRIKELRKLNKMTLKDLSDITNIKTGQLSEVENNKKSLSLESLEAVCNAFKITLSDFFDSEKEIREEEDFLNKLTEEKRLLFCKIKDLEIEDVKKVLKIIRIFDEENE
jgi:transcriptional regulator with XRE-family HTH domain